MRVVCSTGNVLEELLTLLKLEKIEENIFRGQSQDLGYGAIFGGQVLGQALSAACQTVPADRQAHSLHAYFLRPGDVTRPIVYEVDCIRDGKSFTTRRVRAVQKGRAIFSMSVSFQIQEKGYEHQDEIPEVPGPENLISELEFMESNADLIPHNMRDRFLCKRPIELRNVKPFNYFKPEKSEPKQCRWFRTIDRLPDDPMVHQYLLAYASDFHLVGIALYPHAQSSFKPQIQTASLDHTMWFHRPFRMDEWMLYDIQSPSASGARGLSIGKIFSREGALVATVAQEGLLRNWDFRKS